MPFVYWKLDNDIHSARFLTKRERAQAMERLRANQGGGGSPQLQWSQVVETFLDIKTYWFIGMALANNLGAQVTNTFGPLILSGLGFDKYKTSLLNMPFGALQYILILAVAYAALKVRWKSLTLIVILIPILAGLILLYIIPRDGSQTATLLIGYYFLAFIFGGNPLIVSWILANTAGQTKKSVMMACYQAAASTGNIIGPLLFNSVDAPSYHPGLQKTLGVFAMFFLLVLLQIGNLFFLNRRHEKTRIANGKPAKLLDHSMEERYVDMTENSNPQLGSLAFANVTDLENDEFIYVY